MSRVFVAIEHALGRAVVVKVLKPELGAGVNRERFRREIMLAAQLQHPHIVPVLNAGEHGDLLWYTMPFVEGVSLRDSLIHAGSFSARTVTRVLHDVLDALAYAHRRGVIHRDIKPGNILHHGSHSLVTDFGVAKALSAIEALTTPTATISSGASAPAAAASGERTPPPAAAPTRRRLGPILGAAALALVVTGVVVARGVGRSRDRSPTVPVIKDSIALAIPPVRLTHDDSLRIADAVRTQMTKARLNATKQPNAAGSLDSLQRSLVRAYTDSAMREARQARASVPMAAAPRAAVAESAARAQTRNRMPTPPSAATTPPEPPRLSGGPRTTARAAARPNPKAIFARPRRVAI